MKKNRFTPFPVIKTDRLILRQLVIEDEDEIFLLRTDERVNKFLDRPKLNSHKDAEDFIRKINNGIANDKYIYWGISQKDKNRLIGTICLWNFSANKLKAEVGFELNPDFQGQGIMQDALSKIIIYGFDILNLHTIEAYTNANNSKSIKLLEKNKFTFESFTEEKYSHKDGTNNTAVYSLKNSSPGNIQSNLE